MDFKGEGSEDRWNSFLTTRALQSDRLHLRWCGLPGRIGSQVIPCSKGILEIDGTYLCSNSLNIKKEFAASVAKAFALEGGVEIEEKVDLSTFLA